MILGRLKMYAIGVAVFIAAIFGIYFKGKSAGKQQVENEHMRRRVDAMKTAKDVRDEVDSDPYLIDRANKWVRTKGER